MGALAGWSGPAADGPRYAECPELALSAVLYLMSRFPANRSAAVAGAVAEHLRVLCDDTRQPACVREAAGRLIGDWCAYGLLAGGALQPGSLPS